MGETCWGDKIKFYLKNVQLEILIRHLMEMSSRRHDMIVKSGAKGRCQGWRIYRSGIIEKEIEMKAMALDKISSKVSEYI